MLFHLCTRNPMVPIVCRSWLNPLMAGGLHRKIADFQVIRHVIEFSFRIPMFEMFGQHSKATTRTPQNSYLYSSIRQVVCQQRDSCQSKRKATTKGKKSLPFSYFFGCLCSFGLYRLYCFVKASSNLLVGLGV